MQSLIVKLKQEVYLLRQKLIVTNGGVAPATDKALKDKPAEEKVEKADTKKATSSKPLLSARTRANTTKTA